MNHQTRRDDLPETPWASDGLCVDMPVEIFAGAQSEFADREGSMCSLHRRSTVLALGNHN